MSAVLYLISLPFWAVGASRLATSKNRQPELWFFLVLLTGGFGLLLLTLLPSVCSVGYTMGRICPHCLQRVEQYDVACHNCLRALPTV